MSGAHTPGPWQLLQEEVDKPYIRVRGTILGGRYKICNVTTPIYEGVHVREAQETRANAILIAAAPDLLKALKKSRRELHACQAVIHLCGGFDPAYVDDAQLALKVIDAAIAKATGAAS